jgi:hypothetical protein
MAFTDPIVLAYDAGTINLNRINQDQFGATYFGEATNKRVTLTVKHTIPPRGGFGESHMVRVDIEHYDPTTFAYLRTASAWMAIRTDDNTQDTECSEDVTESVVDFLTDPNIVKLVGRQS